MRLIITRPAEDAGHLASVLRELGHEPLVCPLLEIVFPPLAPISLDGIAALIATSRNALRGLAANPAFEVARGLPVYCVGDATAAFARQLGFGEIRTGAGTAKDLALMISGTTQPQNGTLLYLTGKHLAFDMETTLAAEGFGITRVVVYEARGPSEATVTRLLEVLRNEEADGIILMSPRTTTHFAAILTRAALRQELRAITCYCYSEAIAQPLRAIRELTVKVAERPGESDLLALIGAER